MTYEVKSLNEECGVFCIWGHPDAATNLSDFTASNTVVKRGEFSQMMWSLKRRRDMGFRSFS